MVITFQETVKKLEQFWRSKGCSIMMTYDIEMGAATFHPQTVLSVVNNKPAKLAFIQPCRRPQDARGGDSPNRLYKHHQFQVIMIPPPHDIQKMVLNSLYYCGIDPRKHNVDFIENNWQSPSMGASGKGYEIHCNGTEVLQFTYFQQIAGCELDLIPVELAYGIERLCLVTQNKEHIYDIVWDRIDNANITYKEINSILEIEHGRVLYPKQSLKNIFDLHEELCLNLSQSDDLIPAYEVFLKLSHLFNLIESAGGLSVNERVNYLFRVRQCANACLSKHIKQNNVKENINDIKQNNVKGNINDK